MFVFSKMTVIKDSESRDDYTRLLFVEFLEMVCRIALKEDSRDSINNTGKFNLTDIVCRYTDKLFKQHDIFPLDKVDYMDNNIGEDNKGYGQSALSIIEATLKKVKAAKSETEHGGGGGLI